MTTLLAALGWLSVVALGYVAACAFLAFAVAMFRMAATMGRVAGDAIGVAAAWPVEKALDRIDLIVAHGVEWRARRKIWRAEFRKTMSWDAFQRQMEGAPPRDDYSDALSLFALSEPFKRADLDARFKRIMQGVHPDQGGSEFLARMANDARALILKRKGWKR